MTDPPTPSHDQFLDKPDQPLWWQPEGEVHTTELRELREISTGALFVNVDFNDLLNDFSEERAYEIVGRLKDLLA